METFTEQDINETNKKVIFSPEFIPYRLHEKKLFNLNHIETLIYGFIRFYLGLENKKFYFTNEDLAEMLDYKVPTIKKAFRNLYEKGIIKGNFQSNGQGGTTRQIYYINIPSNNPKDTNVIPKDTSIQSEGYKCNTRRILLCNPKDINVSPNKNINNNSKREEKKEENSSSLKNQTLYDGIIDTYNQIVGRKAVKSSSLWSSNVDHWLTIYEEKDIIRAVWHLLLIDDVWQPLKDLKLFFRRRNKAGNVDHIGEMLIKEVPKPDSFRGKSVDSNRYGAILDYYQIFGD